MAREDRRQPARRNILPFARSLIPSFRTTDAAALLLSLLALFAAYLVAERIFERVPHLEDEIAYVWQARAMAGGAVSVPTPELPKRFIIPFVVDFEGQRFGKYPLGWPALLSVGERLGLRDWVNPLLAGLAVWFTYRLGKKIMGPWVGLTAALLTLSSPFFWMVSGSLLSHPLGLVLALMFAVAWLDLAHPPQRRDLPGWLPAVAAGGALGVLAVARPFTAIGIALPYALHAACLLLRGSAGVRGRIVLAGGLALLVSSLHLLWQAAVTGDPFMNPYELWWPYDKVGFGPGYGVTDSGHTWGLAMFNTRFTLWVGWNDLFGWWGYSWLLLPFGAWAARRNGRALLAGSVAPVLLGMYMAYWVGAWTFGLRYVFEGLFSLTILSAAGLCWLAGWPLAVGESYRPQRGVRKGLRLGSLAVVAFLVMVNLSMYLPVRFDSMRELYGISRQALAPFEQAGDLAPAVIIVHSRHWTGYGALLELEDPFLTSPFIFVWGEQPGMKEIMAEVYPDRAIYHYYPDEPGRFYTGRR